MLQQTSLTAYLKFKEHFNNQELLILKLLRNYPQGLTYNEISQMTGIRINAVCGRMNELKSCYAVLEYGIRLNNTTNVHNKVWVFNPQVEL